MTMLVVYKSQKHWEHVNLKIQDKNIKTIRKGHVRNKYTFTWKDDWFDDKQLLKAHL